MSRGSRFGLSLGVRTLRSQRRPDSSRGTLHLSRTRQRTKPLGEALAELFGVSVGEKTHQV